MQNYTNRKLFSIILPIVIVSTTVLLLENRTIPADWLKPQTRGNRNLLLQKKKTISAIAADYSPKVQRIVAAANKDKQADPDAKGGYDKRTMIKDAFKLEFKKTRDTRLNAVPRYRLLEAAKYADDLKLKRGAVSGTQGALTGLNWVERGPNNIGGRTRAILVDLNDASGNTVWAGSVSGGLWKTSNALGANQPLWKPINNFFQNLNITCISQNPQSPNLIYFGTGEDFNTDDELTGDGIWKSADGGNTWNQLASTVAQTPNSTFSNIQKVLDYTIGGTEYLFACTATAGVQLSKDGGNTWKEVVGHAVNNAVPVSTAADIEQGADGALYAALGLGEQGGIYKSTNNGATWSQLTKGLPTSGYQRIVLGCATSNAAWVYALFTNAGNSPSCKGVYRSTNGGSAWQAVTNPNVYGGGNFAGNQADYALALGVDPSNEKHILVGGLDLAASLDGGNTWKTVSQWAGDGGLQNVHADHHAIVFDPQTPDNIYFGNDGGIYATNNGTQAVPTVLKIDSSYNVTQFYHAAVSPLPGRNNMLAGAQDNGNIQFTKAAISPGNDVTGGDGAYVHIDDDNPNLQIAAYVYSNYYVSTDGFTSQNAQNVVIGGDNEGLFVNPTDYDSRDKTLYGGDVQGSYNMVLNVGTGNTSRVKAIPSFTGNVTAIRVSPNKRHRVFFGFDDGTLFVLDNANGTNPIVTKIDAGSLPSGNYLACITVEPGNDNHLIVCFSNYGLKGRSVWETKNGGASWASITGNLPDMPIRSICFKPYSNAAAIIGTDLGVWSTDNISSAATVWAESNTGLARVSTRWVDYRKSDGMLFAATHGRGLYTSTSFTKPIISFVKSDTSVNRNDLKSATNGDCRAYKDIMVPVQLSMAPSANASVKVAISSGSMVKGIDYDLLTTANLNFTVAGNQFITVRLYNAAEALANDTLNITISLTNSTGTNATITPFPDFNAFKIFVNNQQPLSLPVQTVVDLSGTTSTFVGPNRTVYFYDGTPANHLIASIKNNSSTALGCIKLAVDRAGNNSNVPFINNIPANFLASKTYKLLANTAAASGLNYTVSLYYTNAEVTKWAFGSKKTLADLKILKVANHAIGDVTPATPFGSSITVSPPVTGTYNSTNATFSATFTSISTQQGFGIGSITTQFVQAPVFGLSGNRDHSNVILTWQNAAEGNSLGAEIQRATDGGMYETIGVVNADNTPYQGNAYHFTDNFAPAADVYYRLKQTDAGGNIAYSNIVVLPKFMGNDVAVRENPFGYQLTLLFKGKLEGNASVDVFDVVGRKVYSTSKSVQGAMPLNVGNLPAGIYVVSVFWNEKRYTLKVVKS